MLSGDRPLFPPSSFSPCNGHPTNPHPATHILLCSSPACSSPYGARQRQCSEAVSQRSQGRQAGPLLPIGHVNPGNGVLLTAGPARLGLSPLREWTVSASALSRGSCARAATASWLCWLLLM